MWVMEIFKGAISCYLFITQPKPTGIPACLVDPNLVVLEGHPQLSAHDRMYIYIYIYLTELVERIMQIGQSKIRVDQLSGDLVKTMLQFKSESQQAGDS